MYVCTVRTRNASLFWRSTAYGMSCQVHCDCARKATSFSISLYDTLQDQPSKATSSYHSSSSRSRPYSYKHASSASSSSHHRQQPSIQAQHSLYGHNFPYWSSATSQAGAMTPFYHPLSLSTMGQSTNLFPYNNANLGLPSRNCGHHQRKCTHRYGSHGKLSSNIRPYSCCCCAAGSTRRSSKQPAINGKYYLYLCALCLALVH